MSTAARVAQSMSHLAGTTFATERALRDAIAVSLATPLTLDSLTRHATHPAMTNTLTLDSLTRHATHPAMTNTLLVIADGYLWEAPVADCPGAVLPDAREKLLAAKARAHRVVIASFCANTHAGAQRCRAIIERDLALPLSASFDLHTANGFPIFDEVVS